MKKQCNDRYTRTISPRLGLLGLLDFAGLVGLLPVFSGSDAPLPFPLLFFCFFGFFGFYYEGRMSHTLKDERFAFNALRAEALATRIGLGIVLVGTVLTISLLRVEQPCVMVKALFALIGAAWGLTTFLSQYLLYRYDCEE